MSARGHLSVFHRAAFHAPCRRREIRERVCPALDSSRTCHTPFAAQSTNVRVNELVDPCAPSPLPDLRRSSGTRGMSQPMSATHVFDFQATSTRASWSCPTRSHCWGARRPGRFTPSEPCRRVSSSRPGRVLPRPTVRIRTGGVPSPRHRIVRTKRPTVPEPSPHRRPPRDRGIRR
jgi:hypothetical protein